TTAVFDYPDISSISKHICECVKNNSESVVGDMHSTSVSANTTSKTPKNIYTNNNDIAVIGMAAALPGANTIQEFWENFLHGRDSIEIVPPGRWNQDILYEQISEQVCPSWGGFIDNPYLFDPHFFNISPSEAELMDPQQRLFLQNAWHAFEDAGYTLENLYNLNCGVFVGCSINDYHRLIEQISTPTSAYTMMGNSHAILASRIAYFLNLKGVCTTLDTACSSSLLAVHMACEFLRSGELSISIAGGVNVLNTPQFHLFANKAGMLSSVGRCQTFSEAADGFVPAEGVANVILKPLKSAEKDGDRIYAVIKASNSNQDGHTNGITAPNGLSQTELQEKTYERFGINPRNIAYVEAHGTGTSLGDPIEVDALTRSFRRYTTDKHFCAIGSIKSNIGHTLATAGIAGLIKAILCVKEACLPASLHQNTLNKRINFADSPFYTLSKNLDWPSQFTSRMAAVNSFGYSGTNVHIVLENYDNKKLDSPGVGFQLCVLSAKSEASLKSGIYNLNRMLSQENNNFLLYSLCYTLALHKNHFEKRTAFVTHSIEDLKSQLHSYLEGKTESSRELLGNEEMEVLLRNLFSSDRQFHLQKLANHYCAGGDVVWSKIFTDKSNRVAVPLYAFDRDEYKIGNSVNLSNDQNNVNVNNVDVNKNPEVGNNNIKLKNFSIKKSKNILTKNNDHDHEIKKMLNKDIMSAVSEVLKINIEKINLKNDIRNYGFDSINIVDLSNLLNKKYQISILPPQLFEFNNLENFSNFLLSSYGGTIHEYYVNSTETLRKCKNNENKIKTSLESIDLKTGGTGNHTMARREKI
ncbi:MAG: beta-ketoacyl synthase N-terminal-like domain-containing protein, partial [Exilibacterium sp.]